MKTVTRNELLNLFSSFKKKAVFASMDVETVPRPLPGVKKKILKCAKVNVVLGPRDNLEERPWGRRLPDCNLVEHKGKVYVEVLVQSEDAEYIDQETGEVIPNGAELVRQNPSNLRDFSLDSIKQVRVQRDTFVRLP